MYPLSRLKHLHPFCPPSFGLQMSCCKQCLAQHLANTISFLCLSILSNILISDASVFMLSSWMIVRRQTITMLHNTVVILESWLKRNRNTLSKISNWSLNIFMLVLKVRFGYTKSYFYKSTKALPKLCKPFYVKMQVPLPQRMLE